MGVADVTHNFGARHAMRMICNLSHMLGIERLEIAWPAATRIKLGVGFKKRCITAYASVDAVLVVIPKLACESSFGRRVSGYLIFNFR